MTCTDHSWHTLWDAFNTHQTENIRVPRKALADVLACHGATPSTLIAIPPREASESVVVSRAVLFGFLKEHGEGCGREYRDDVSPPVLAAMVSTRTEAQARAEREGRLL